MARVMRQMKAMSYGQAPDGGDSPGVAGPAA
jgi:hypothetical protein